MRSCSCYCSFSPVFRGKKKRKEQWEVRTSRFGFRVVAERSMARDQVEEIR